MGRFQVEVELANNADVIDASRGLIPPEKVRRVRIEGVVDSGAARLVIPETIVKELGLTITGSTGVRFADGRTANRAVSNQVHLRYLGRDGIFTAIIEPGRQTALIGAIVLEDLDLLVDCKAGKLVPRDPNQIISEVE